MIEISRSYQETEAEAGEEDVSIFDSTTDQRMDESVPLKPQDSSSNSVDVKETNHAYPPSTLSAIVNMANVTVGAGTLAIPYGIQQCGIILGSMLLIILAILANYSLRLLLWTAELTPGGAVSFQEVALAASGRKAAIFVDICVFCLCFSCLLAYTIIIGNVISISIFLCLFLIEYHMICKYIHIHMYIFINVQVI